MPVAIAPIKMEVKGNFVRENRLGWFDLSMAFVQQAPQMLMKSLFTQCLVVRAEHVYAANPFATVTRYWCYSPLFESLRAGVKTPQYAIEFTEVGGEATVEAKRVDPKSELEKENKALTERHAQVVELNRKLASLIREVTGLMNDEQSTEATILLRDSGVE